MTTQAHEHPFLVNEEVTNFSVDGYMPDISLLVSTTSNGLLLVNKDSITRLIQADIFYGITKEAENWWVFGQLQDKGSIISFNILDQKGYNLRVRVDHLEKAVHQIDFVGDELLVVETFKNWFITYRDAAKHDRMHARSDSASILTPKGLAVRGTDNYCHLNSIYAYKDNIFVLGHNETYKTGKDSEIFVYDLEFRPRGTIATRTSCAHNYYEDSDGWLICDSAKGTLLKDGAPVFTCDDKSFTRGLSVADDYVVLGSSGISPARDHRRFLDGILYIMDREFNRIAKITIPKTQIMDIKRVDKSDYALSNTEKK